MASIGSKSGAFRSIMPKSGKTKQSSERILNSNPSNARTLNARHKL